MYFLILTLLLIQIAAAFSFKGMGYQQKPQRLKKRKGSKKGSKKRSKKGSKKRSKSYSYEGYDYDEWNAQSPYNGYIDPPIHAQWAPIPVHTPISGPGNLDCTTGNCRVNDILPPPPSGYSRDTNAAANAENGQGINSKSTTDNPVIICSIFGVIAAAVVATGYFIWRKRQNAKTPPIPSLPRTTALKNHKDTRETPKKSRSDLKKKEDLHTSIDMNASPTANWEKINKLLPAKSKKMANTSNQATKPPRW
jgi:hypothetical protein